jgi:hypothetical protein
MGADRNMLLRAMVLAAVKYGKEQSKTPTEVLEDIIVGRFTTDFQDGKTVISTTEAGGTTTFALASDMSPAEVVALAMEAVSWIKSQPNPDAPEIYPRRLKRLRVSFRKAMTS